MDTCTLKKVPKSDARQGPMSQLYLAAGQDVALRMWEGEVETDGIEGPARDYETVGYVISGQAELTIERQTISLVRGDSWVVSKGAAHSYKIIEAFTAVEATSPPARWESRDGAQ